MFKVGDIVRRKGGTGNGVYLARVTGYPRDNEDHGSPWVSVVVTEVLQRSASGSSIEVGQEMTHASRKWFTLETPRGAVTGRISCAEPNLSQPFPVTRSSTVVAGLERAVEAGAEEIRRLQDEVADLRGKLQRSESAYEGRVKLYRTVVKNRNRWRERAVEAERQAAIQRGVNGVPRNLLVVLTAPGADAREAVLNGGRGSMQPLMEADMAVAVSVDAISGQVVKSRYAREDDTTVTVRWARG